VNCVAIAVLAVEVLPGVRSIAHTPGNAYEPGPKVASTEVEKTAGNRLKVAEGRCR
jgi:hypothetical protein